MVSVIRQCYLFIVTFLFCLPVLTGCPGDRWRFDEEATVSTMGDNVCFTVPDAGNYQPVDIAINPRGTPSKEKNIIFNPMLRVVNGQLCIPPAFYHFPDKGQFIVSYVLLSERHKAAARKMVAGVEISSGCIFNIPLTVGEISRPYSEIKNGEVASDWESHAGSCEHPYSSAPSN